MGIWKRFLSLVTVAAAVLLGVTALNTYEAPAEPGAPAAAAEGNAIVLDLDTGSILNVALGMDEEALLAGFQANGIAPVSMVAYPDYLLFQLPTHPGIIFRFHGKQVLNEIYTNSRAVSLSNGLRLGDPIKDFTDRLGKPVSSRRLPSGVGDELVYVVGKFELAVIRTYAHPDVARAVTLRPHKGL